MPPSDKSGPGSGDGNDGDAIQVLVRVRPPDDQSELKFDNGHCIQVDTDQKAVFLSCKPDPKIFTYDSVAGANATQASLFWTVGKKSVDSCIQGYNSTIFAYGQTGSGKTFTMLGPSEYSEELQDDMRGVIPRSFEYLFNCIPKEEAKQEGRVQFLCKCSFMEIYQEQIFDLLDPASSNLHVREHIKKGVYVEGLTEETITSSSEAFQVLSEGQRNRRVGSTSMNRESSRSHAVFIISIESREKKEGIEKVKSSQLNLVDLAGSERTKDTNATGQRLKEGCNINKSLAVLGHVILSLVQKQKYVPYRDSKLSFLLRDSLGGNAKTFMIACVHPGAKYYSETLSTLQFARRAKLIKNKATLNEDMHGSIADLQAEIKKLKEQLQQYASGAIPHEPSTAESQGDEEVSGMSSGRTNSVWRKHFLEAMMLREIAEQDKKSLEEKKAGQEQELKARDYKIMAINMRVKFKESALQMLEKHLKAGDPDGDAKDGVICNLREEIKMLQKELEHNPVVTKFAVENQNLRSEIKTLRSLESNRNIVRITEQKARDLEKIYKDLMNENQQPQVGGEFDRRLSLCTNPAAEGAIDAAAVEKLKSQINHLQSQLESAKQELSEKEAVSKKMEMDLKADLASKEKTIADLHHNLEAKNTSSRNERKSITDMHIETIREITTPKKALYNLRNRTILKPMSGGSIQFDLTAEEDGMEEKEEAETLMDVEMPDQMKEQALDALLEEIKKLNEKNNENLKTLEDRETEMLTLKQNASKLEHQVESMTAERLELVRERDSSVSQLEALTLQLQQVTDNFTMMEGEKEDYRVLLQQADKEIATYKSKIKLSDEEKEKEKAAIETKLLRIEIEHFNLQKEYQAAQDEKLTLEEQVENLQDTKSFMEGQVATLEEQLKTSMETCKEKEVELKSLTSQMEAEREKVSKMTAQLATGHEVQQELGQALEENSRLQNQCSVLQSQCDAQDQKTSLLVQELETAKNAVREANKEAERDKAAIGDMMTRIQDQKSQISENAEILAVLRSELTARENDVYLLECQKQDTQTALEEKTKQMDELSAKFVLEKEQLSAIESMLREDLEVVSETLAESEGSLESLKKEYQEQAEVLQEQLNQKTVEMEAMREELQSRLADMETKASLSLEEGKKYCTIIEEKTEELDKLTKLLEKAQGDSDELRSKVELLQEEDARKTEELNTAVGKLETLKVENALPQNENKELLTTVEQKTEELEKLTKLLETAQGDSDELKSKMELLQAEDARKTEELKSALEKMEALKEETSLHQKQIRDLVATVEQKTGDVEKFTKLLEEAQGDSDDLRSKVELLQEEDARKTEEMKSALENMEAMKVETSLHQKEIRELVATVEEKTRDMEKLTKLLEEAQGDGDDLRSKVELLQEEDARKTEELKSTLEKMETLREENARLVGHQNPKQKIQYHMSLKDENNRLMEELVKTRDELTRLKLAHKKPVESCLKENMHPTTLRGTPKKSVSS